MLIRNERLLRGIVTVKLSQERLSSRRMKSRMKSLLGRDKKIKNKIISER